MAHPDLIATARAEFDAVLGDRPNQVDRLRPDVHVTADQLLDVASITGDITDAGVHSNVSVAVRYIESWLRGVGAAAIDNLMEDAATAEISRSQLWQWIREGAKTVEGTPITRELIERLLGEVVGSEVQRSAGDRFDDAVEVFRTVTLAEDYPTFLTIPAYVRYLVDPERSARAAA